MVRRYDKENPNPSAAPPESITCSRLNAASKGAELNRPIASAGWLTGWVICPVR